jgi:hypothetical protein
VTDSSPRQNSLWDDHALRAFLAAQREFCEKNTSLSLSQLNATWVHPVVGDEYTSPKGIGLIPALGASRQIVLVGDKESGKTMQAKGLAHRLSSGLTAALPVHLENRLPIYLDLSQLSIECFEPSKDLMSAVVHTAHQLLANRKNAPATIVSETIVAVVAWVQRGDILLILDGIDALNREQREVVKSWPGNHQVLVTSRLAIGAGFEGFKVKYLLPFELQHLSLFISDFDKGQPATNDRYRHLIGLIADDKKLKALVSQPFWINIILNLTLKNIPVCNSKGLLLKRFMEELLGKRNHAAQKRLKLSYSQSLGALSTMAFNLLPDRAEAYRTFGWYADAGVNTREPNTVKRCEAIMAQSMLDEADKENAKLFLKEVFHSPQLMKTNASGEVEFCSESVMHYFAANYLCHKIASPGFVRGTNTTVTPEMLGRWTFDSATLPVLQMTTHLMIEAHGREWVGHMVEVIAQQTGDSYENIYHLLHS